MKLQTFLNKYKKLTKNERIRIYTTLETPKNIFDIDLSNKTDILKNVNGKISHDECKAINMDFEGNTSKEFKIIYHNFYIAYEDYQSALKDTYKYKSQAQAKREHNQTKQSLQEMKKSKNKRRFTL